MAEIDETKTAEDAAAAEAAAAAAAAAALIEDGDETVDPTTTAPAGGISSTRRRSEYVFGFGSIMSTSTHGPWLVSSSSSSEPSPLPGQVATIKKSFGLVRGWNFRSKTGFTALGVLRVNNNNNNNNSTEKGPGGSGSGSDGANHHQQATEVNGVLFRITANMLRGFDVRETGYDRVEIPIECIRFGPVGDGSEPLNVRPNEKIWIYIPQRDYLSLADVDHPILQSYVDTVMQGCLEWGGEAMCEEFVVTTTDWSPYFLNDTPSSRRPWLFRKDYAIIDRVLSKYPSTHFQDRRHPEEFASAFLIKLLRGSWAVPKRNQCFTGRDIEIEEIHRRLTTQQRGGATNSMAKLEVVGMGGVGKTQICTEYCYRYFPSYYGLIIWLKAQSAESIVASYRQLMADTTGVDVKEKATDEVVAEIKARLFRSKIPWLLVFDNLEDHSLLDKFLPNGGTTGHVLVTSRLIQPNGDASFNNFGSSSASDAVMMLGCFHPSESVELLIRSAGRENIRSAEQVDAAHRLADRLGHLPLALSMAAAYMFRCDVDCLEYLSRYVKSEDENSGMVLGSEGVASSLSLSLNAIRNENIAAWEALRMLAWLGPDQITKKLLRSLLAAKAEQGIAEEEAAAFACAEASAIALNSASSTPLLGIGGIALLALIRCGRSRRPGGTACSLFVFLAAATGIAIQTKLKQMSATTAFHSPSVVQTASGAFETPDLRRNATGDVFERTDEIWNILKSFSLLTVKEGNGSIHRLLAQALRASQGERDSNRNLQICLRALIKTWTFKPDKTDTWQGGTSVLEHVKEVVAHVHHRNSGVSQLAAAVLSREAGLFSAMALNRFEEAQTSLELSLRMLDSTRGTSVAGARAAAYHELGRVYRYKGHFKDSEGALLKALEIRKQAVKSDPVARHGLAATLHELGVLEVKKHNLDGAADFLQQALDLRRTLERDSHREETEAACASTLHQLAAVHLARKPPALDIAQSLLDEALGLSMQIGQRAATLKQLARVNIRQGEFDKAERRLTQAIELYKELYGENTLHINVAAVNFQRGVLAFQREEHELAWQHFSECLQARKAVYSYLQGNHIEVSTVLHELSCVAMAQKRFDVASKLLEEEKGILDQLCDLSSYQRERLYQARLNNLTWLRKAAKELGDDEKAKKIAGERSDLKHALKNDKPHNPGCEETPNSPLRNASSNHQVILLQQEALRCRLVARQFALSESRNKDAAVRELNRALANLSKEAERSSGNDATLYDAVVQFHESVSQAMEDFENKRPVIFKACDRLRDVLREQGVQVNDTISRKVK